MNFLMDLHPSVPAIRSGAWGPSPHLPEPSPGCEVSFPSHPTEPAPGTERQEPDLFPEHSAFAPWKLFLPQTRKWTEAKVPSDMSYVPAAKCRGSLAQ